MRLPRLIVGLAVILFALWVIIGEQMAGTSANAMVNARLSTLRAPIAGVVGMPDRALGANIRQGEEMGAIRDPRADKTRLNDLVLELQYIQTERGRVQTLIANTQGLMSDLTTRRDRFAEGKIEELEIRLRHARNRLELLGGGSGEQDKPNARPSIEPPAIIVPEAETASTVRLEAPRAKRGLVIAANPDRSLPLGAVTDLKEGVDLVSDRISTLQLEYAREQVAVLETALAAAREGVFIADSYNDAPNSEQRLTELQTLLSGLQADSEASAARMRALASRITEERLSVNLLTEAPIEATATGQLWEVLAADGERVQRGQDLLRLLDCDSLFVTASVSEGVYNRLRPGESAKFRLAGRGEVFEATVERLAGSGAATIYQNLAVAPGPRQLERFDVAVQVPGLRTGESASDCPVGQTGRVFFEARPFDWLRGLL